MCSLTHSANILVVSIIVSSEYNKKRSLQVSIVYDDHIKLQERVEDDFCLIIRPLESKDSYC